MSEKTLWDWINKKMKGQGGWEGHRIENCSSKGIPDAVVSMVVNNARYSTFIELKDWSEKNKHPLSVDQKNFLEAFGGIVLVKVSKEEIRAHYGEVDPLLTCDLEWAKSHGIKIDMKKPLPKIMAGAIVENSYWWRTAIDSGFKE